MIGLIEKSLHTMLEFTQARFKDWPNKYPLLTKVLGYLISGGKA